MNLGEIDLLNDVVVIGESYRERERMLALLFDYEQDTLFPLSV